MVRVNFVNMVEGAAKQDYEDYNISYDRGSEDIYFQTVSSDGLVKKEKNCIRTQN